MDSDLEPVIKKESVKRHERKVNEIVNSSEMNLGKNKAYKVRFSTNLIQSIGKILY